MTLFDAAPAHDPGGRVKTALPAGMVGEAEFSGCGRYRLMVSVPLAHAAREDLAGRTRG